MRPLTGEGSLRCCIGATHSPDPRASVRISSLPNRPSGFVACALSQDLNSQSEIPHHARSVGAAVMPRGPALSAPAPHPIPSEGDLVEHRFGFAGGSRQRIGSNLRWSADAEGRPSALELSGGSGLSAGRVLALPATCKTGRKADSSASRGRPRMRTQPATNAMTATASGDAWQAVLGASLPERDAGRLRRRPAATRL